MSETRTDTFIVGGGLAGVSTAFHLPKGSVALAERESDVGGTARSFYLDGFTFDFTGHLLHLHNAYTKKLIPRLLNHDFYTCTRKTSIFSKGVSTNYPFQVFTHGLPETVIDECVLGYFERYKNALPPEKRSRNFARWCDEVFGPGIAKHFMLPYNEKLYQTKASNMTTDWCGPFVPMPNLSDVISGALGLNAGTFGYNATFLYPRKGGIQALPAAMAKGVSGIRLKTTVTTIDWRRKRATLSTGEVVDYRQMVNTIPLPELLKVMSPLPAPVAAAAKKLKYASILCLNIGVKRAKISDQSWIYFPEPEFPFYRVGFPMNFTPHVVPKGCSSMYVEVPAKTWQAATSKAALLKDVRRGLERAGILKRSDKLPVVQFLPIRYAYVVYDENRTPALNTIFKFLARQKIQSIGRYGAWKYSFMEEAILDGKKAAEAIHPGEAVTEAAARRLKVVHLITLLELGGAQGNTIHTVRSLDPLRFDARLWCGRGAYWDADVEKDLGAAGRLRFFPHLVRPVHPLFDLLAIFDLWRAFRRERPDVVHTHSSKAGILGRIAARLAGVPVVVHTFHGFGFNDRQRPLVRAVYVGLERWTAGFAQGLVFVSIANQEEAKRRGIGTESQYRLIRSGVPLKRLAELKGRADRAAVRSALQLPANARLVITLSAFKPQKNLKDFVGLAARVAREVPDAAFVLIGDGEQRPALEKMVREKGLEDRFRMPGWRRDASEILAASDVFVLTSLWEGLPRALVEAAALGVPSLCYDTDGVRDLLSPQADEVVRRGDVEGLARGVQRLLQDVFVSQALAEAQASRITDDFDIDAMVRQQERLYLQLGAPNPQE